MFNYNLINPVNIHYRKYPQEQNAGRKINADEQGKANKQNELTPDENGGGRRFPNGNKVAIDYTKNQVNIAQILQDFRSTIAAINTPEDIKEEVESYLGFTSKESLKDAPSREIILSNLKNAARLTDKYIQDSLKKPSRVVQDWVDALFMQQVNLKADPNEINEDFRVKIPQKTAENAPAQTPARTDGLSQLNEDRVEFNTQKEPVKEAVEKESAAIEPEIQYTAEKSYIETAAEPVKSEFTELEEIAIPDDTFVIEEETVEEQPVVTETPKFERTAANSPYTPLTENEALAKEAVFAAKAHFEDGGDVYSTLKLYDEALELVEGSANKNLKSAIYFERAKVFDSYDYAELALIDYHKATKCDDGNLRAQAHIKMGNIYDDYVQFEPAMDQYSRAIEDSEEVNNLQGKTKALRYIASMFAGVYDVENTDTFSVLAMESAKETGNQKTISKTFLEAADNYKYVGQDGKALQVYSALAQDEAIQDDYDTLAQNYMEASMLMDKKGNKKKSYALMVKSKEYQRLARLKRNDAVEA